MKEMTCREFDEVVHAYVRMELLDVQLREAALEHTAACVNCAERLANAIALADASDARGEQTKEEQAPPAVEAAVLAAFRSHHRRASWRRTFEWCTAGAAAAVLLIFLWTLGGRSKGGVQPLIKKDVSSHSSGLVDAQGPALMQPPDGAAEAKSDNANSSVEVAFAGGSYSASDFVPVPYTGSIAADDPGMVVRVQLTRASLAQLGYPVAEQPDDDLIRADVLVDEDGWPRGVKLVR